MKTVPPRPFPLDDLARLLRTGSDDELADRLGVSRRTLLRWATLGMSARQADLAAIRAGLHPAIVWPDAWRAA